MPVSQRVIKVAVPRPLHAVYDYQVPGHFDMPVVGARVRVPFGRSVTVGICVATEVVTPHERLKDVAEVLDDVPVVATELMALAHWMTSYYHHPLGEVLATMLPAAARQGAVCAIDAPDFWRVRVDTFSNKRAPAQTALFDHLSKKGACAGQALTNLGFKRQILRTLAKNGIVERCEPPASVEPAEASRQATAEQVRAINAITADLEGFHAFLLEGVTGSGKTEVYLRAIIPVIEAAGQVLVLVPEIALTPQTLSRFQRRFARVGMLHSNLTNHERLQTWLKCAAGELSLLIGTRSAVFTPFRQLGLIVVDEEHDSAYKQQEGLRYSARDLAIKRAQTNDIPIVLGSATPSLESLYNVNRDRYKRLSLPFRAGGAQLPDYHVIDMRGQQQTDGISVPLERVMHRHLAAAGQVLVFLNRRGYAPTLLCAACGWQAACSACDARMTLHGSPRQLICHHCLQRLPVPERCESCGLQSLLPVGFGTQRSEQGLRELFSEVPIYRIDRDTTRGSRRLEAQFAKINQGHKCIMVGTQMLAKGHHFPNVTLVAVLSADAGFCSPDFRAPERTAQLIVQVAGRAGRAERPGEVWIQSYKPENPTLLRLINDGYAGFAEAELAERIKVGLPPATPMAMLRAEAGDGQQALALLEHFKTQLYGVEILGPVPAPMARIANRSRYQLMVLAKTRPRLHAALRHIVAPKVPHTLRWSIDVDPYDSL